MNHKVWNHAHLAFRLFLSTYIIKAVWRDWGSDNALQVWAVSTSVCPAPTLPNIQILTLRQTQAFTVLHPLLVSLHPTPITCEPTLQSLSSNSQSPSPELPTSFTFAFEPGFFFSCVAPAVVELYRPGWPQTQRFVCLCLWECWA